MEKYNKYNEIVKSKSPCNAEWKRLLAATNDYEYFGVLKDNIQWVQNSGILSDLIKVFTVDELAGQNIFFNGSYSVENSLGIACGNSTVKAWGNSTVKAWDNSTVKACGNSTVKACGNSTVEACDNSTVEAWDNSTVEAWDNSTVEAWGNSTVRACGNSTVEAWGNSTVEAWGNSTVRAWDNSTVEAWGNSSIIFRLYGSPKFSYDKEKSVFVILKDELQGKTHIIVAGVEQIITN